MKVQLTKVNEVYMVVDADDSICRELYDFFSFEVPGAKFMPAVRNRFWDGYIRLFNIKTHRIYVGLFPYIHEFCKEHNYQLETDGEVNRAENRTFDEIKEWSKLLDLPFEPRDYQIEAVQRAVSKGRRLLVSPTASGKSLIIYMLHRWYEHKKARATGEDDCKTLIIVPTTSLVEQMSKDFAEYGYDQPICKIYSGQEYFDANVTISTWQSFSKAPKEWMNQYDVVVGDEAHLFKAKTLTSILEKMKDVTYRFGTTGTLDNSQVHRLQLEGLFGPYAQVVSTYDLMEEGTVAKLGIHCLILNHPKQPKMKYMEEMDYLVSNDKRNNFIFNLVKSLKGNTLVLFQYVEKHGVVLYNMMQPQLKDRLHYVYGGTDAKDREEVRGLVESSNNGVILASYGTFSTGINIRRINNIVFASPSKSKIRNLQSIGRGLRISDDKTEVKLYDIADNLNGDNFTLRHLKDRINIYSSEGFDYQIHEIKL